MQNLVDPGSKSGDHDSHNSKGKYLQVLAFLHRQLSVLSLKGTFTWLTPIGQKEPHGSPISNGARKMERQEYSENSSNKYHRYKQTFKCLNNFSV